MTIPAACLARVDTLIRNLQLMKVHARQPDQMVLSLTNILRDVAQLIADITLGIYHE